MEHFIDSKSDIGDDIKNMQSKFDFVDTNAGDFIQDEIDHIKDMSNISGDRLEDAKDIARNMLDKLGKRNTNLMADSPKKELFNFSWKLYRTFSLVVIFLSFFVLRFVADKLKERSSSEYIIDLFKVVSVLIILNLCAYLFYKTFYRYLTTIKGIKGPPGRRGVKGIPGENDSCNIYNKKLAPFNRDLTKDKKPPKEKIMLDTEGLAELKKKDSRGVYNPNKQPNIQWYIKDGDNDIIPSNTKIGMGCNTDTGVEKCKENGPFDFIQKNKQKLLQIGAKPIIGAAVNYNKLTKNIEAIQYYYDKNKKHNKNKHKIGVFGLADKLKQTAQINLNSGTIGTVNVTKHSEKHHFNCEPNSAIYKVEGVYDTGGIKGIKFYCQDIKTGKSTKSFNKDNEKVYGVNFGIDAVPDNDSYLYSKIECPYKNFNESKTDKYFPSFISNVGGMVRTPVTTGSEQDNYTSIKSLDFNRCSFFDDN